MDAIVVISSCLAVAVAAAEPIAPSPVHDDAALHDVQFIGSAAGYAVGDQGTVWRTSDGGQTWRFVPTPTTASLHSASFLTDQVGWVAGVECVPFTRLAVGVLLKTTDGGQTWQRLGETELPGLEYVRFFDPDEGIVVGRASPAAPTGIFRTADAGETWHPVNGPMSAGWLAARFLAPDRGVVAGAEGRLSLVAGEELLPARLPPLGGRSIHDVALTDNAIGWLVGDGGLVLTTSSGGTSWSTPPAPLPAGVQAVCNFRCVEQRGPNVWLAGAPGGVVWHSADAGRTWSAGHTGQPAPIYKLRFTSDRNGVAVGALGGILTTRDGGETWHAVHGADRRIAVLSVPSRTRRFSPELFGPLCLEAGYRTAVHVPVNTAVIDGLSSAHDGVELLDAAVQALGGSSASMGRQLGVDLPGLDRHANHLQARWQAQSEGRAVQTLVGSLVKEIRTWRPNVVIIDEPGDDDIYAEWLKLATLAAVTQARDATRELDQIDFGGVSTWSVDRVFLQLPDGSRGDVNFDAQALLPRTGSSARMIATAARSQWEPALPPRSSLAFRAIDPAMKSASATDLLAGLNLAPGSAARRALPPISGDGIEQAQRRVQRTRNLLAIADQTEPGSPQAAQLVAQLPDVARDLQPDQAAAMMAQVALRFRRQSQWEHAEATYLDLVRRYPSQPAALDALRWLLQYWTSAEVAWQRLKATGVTQVRSINDVDSLPGRVEQAVASGSEFLAAPRTIADILQQRATKNVDRGLANTKPLGAGAPPDSLATWRQRAAELAQQLADQSPALFRQPEIQFPLAALRRARGSAGQADAIYRQFHFATADDAMRQLVERELWLGVHTAEVPRKILSCRFTTERPHLDGVLSDGCWQDAREVWLGAADADDARSAPMDSESHALLMFAYDQEFLYVAGSVPRHRAAPADPPQLSGRTHDADMSRHDWLGLALDTDRDYMTWHELRVDQRGWTSDRCWDDDGWNPQWYVAADADDARWRVEVAIPWSELAPQPPQANDVWAISLVRTVPALAQEAWSGRAQWPPRWDNFGLLRFESAGR